MIGVTGPWGSWQPPRQDQEQLQLEKMQLQHNPTGRMSSRALPSEVIRRDEAHRGVNLQGATLVRQKLGRGPNTLASQLSSGRNFLWIASSGSSSPLLSLCFRSVRFGFRGAYFDLKPFRALLRVSLPTKC